LYKNGGQVIRIWNLINRRTVTKCHRKNQYQQKRLQHEVEAELPFEEHLLEGVLQLEEVVRLEEVVQSKKVQHQHKVGTVDLSKKILLN
jgi:hypothetical protein